MSIERAFGQKGVEKKRRAKRIVAACASVALAAAGATIYYDTKTKADEAVIALQAMPQERNTCSLAEVTASTNQSGNLEVQMVTRVKDKMLPNAKNKDYDGWLVDVQFSDSDGNLDNGLLLEWPNGRTGLSLDSGGPSGPDNRGSLSIPSVPGTQDYFPKWSDGIYSVYRQNSVHLDIDTPMKHSIIKGVAVVKCGEFVMKNRVIESISKTGEA